MLVLPLAKAFLGWKIREFVEDMCADPSRTEGTCTADHRSGRFLGSSEITLREDAPPLFGSRLPICSPKGECTLKTTFEASFKKHHRHQPPNTDCTVLREKRAPSSLYEHRVKIILRVLEFLFSDLDSQSVCRPSTVLYRAYMVFSQLPEPAFPNIST